MLENANLIEGKDATEVNTLIEEYEDITAKVKDLEISKTKVLTRLFELTKVGINETGKVCFNIVENKGRVSIAPKKLQEQAEELYEAIEKLGLISVGNDYLTVRGIKHKGNRT